MCYQTTTLIKIFIHRDSIRKFIHQGKKEGFRPIMNRKPRWVRCSDPNIKKESSDCSSNVPIRPPATDAVCFLQSGARSSAQSTLPRSFRSVHPHRFVSLIYSPSPVYKPSLTNIFHQLTLTL